MTKTARIFNIQRYSIHDGPGIRTSVFFKGCPLRCEWCCNPESQLPHTEVIIDSELCVSCGLCAEKCPSQAIERAQRGEYRTLAERCGACGSPVCAQLCPMNAVKAFGTQYTLSELIALLSRDEAFYHNSSGGVTATGGEALLQSDFVSALFAECRRKGWSTALESSLNVSRKSVEAVSELTDFFLCDVKHHDAKTFARHTKGNLELCLANLEYLLGRGANVTVRIPLIPGFNTDTDSIAGLSDYLHSVGVSRVQLMPYHDMGKTKYAALAREYQWGQFARMSDEKAASIAREYVSRGLEVQIGG